MVDKQRFSMIDDTLEEKILFLGETNQVIEKYKSVRTLSTSLDRF